MTFGLPFCINPSSLIPTFKDSARYFFNSSSWKYKNTIIIIFTTIIIKMIFFFYFHITVLYIKQILDYTLKMNILLLVSPHIHIT